MRKEKVNKKRQISLILAHFFDKPPPVLFPGISLLNSKNLTFSAFGVWWMSSR
jgi:hypothetical protein